LTASCVGSLLAQPPRSDRPPAGSSQSRDNKPSAGSGEADQGARSRVVEDAVKAGEVAQKIAQENERAFLKAFTELRKNLDETGPFSKDRERQSLEDFKQVITVMRRLPALFAGREAELLAKFATF